MGKKSRSKFGDKRLDVTSSDFLEAITSRYSVIIRQVAENKNIETRFQNFLRNPKVTPNNIISHHWTNINTDWSTDHVLVISDSSTLSFPYRADRDELGDVGGAQSKTRPKYTGFDIHPSILINASNSSLQGLGGLDIIKTPLIKDERDKLEQQVRRKMYSKLPFEEKERYKWFRCPMKAIENAPKAKQYTLIGDRETDIYDLIYRTLEQGHDFIYRSNHNRRLFPLTNKQNLHDILRQKEVAFSYHLDVEKTKHRSKHEALLEVKYGNICISSPRNHPDKTLPECLKVQVIEVKEHISTVFNDEEPIHWILLTSHSTENASQVMQIIRWYLERWTIEEVFRTLKRKGLNIETSEVETFHGLTNLTTLALLAAIQTMQLVNARAGKTNQKLDDVFFEQEQQCLILLNEKLQGNTEKTQNPYPMDSLAFGAWVIARLGGWNGYQTERPPGPITMTNGLTSFYQILKGFYLIL